MRFATRPTATTGARRLDARLPARPADDSALPPDGPGARLPGGDVTHLLHRVAGGAAPNR